MKPDYQLIRELEHECGIGLPHGECWDCGTADLLTPLPLLREPIVTRSGSNVSYQWVDQKYRDMKRQKWNEMTARLLSN